MSELSDFYALRDVLMNYRHQFASQLAETFSAEKARRLGETHAALLALQAVIEAEGGK